MSAAFDPTEHGNVLICIDPSSFGDYDSFVAHVDRLTSTIRDTGDCVQIP
jgi:LDH2 family malate/lactate/ureidoglycolate dehydrogenase